MVYNKLLFFKIYKIQDGEKLEENRAVIIGARHGRFGYYEPPVLSGEEYEVARAQVIKSIMRAISEMDVKNQTMIISGPSGRTKLTAQIWKQNLANAGFSVGEIIIDERLTEVKNFSWQLFQPLIDGGVVSISGKTFEVDKRETNPSNLPYPQYFMLSEQKSIPFREQGRWPLEYRRIIEGIESFGKVKARMAEFLEDIVSYVNYPKGARQIIIVTHDALLFQSVNLFTSGAKRSIEPAGFVQLGIRPNKIVVERVCDSSCDITEGNSNADVIKALRR